MTDDERLAARFQHLAPRDQAAALRALRDAGQEARIPRIVHPQLAGPLVMDLLADALLSLERPADALAIVEQREARSHASSTTLGLRTRALAKLGRLDEARTLVGDAKEYLARCILGEALLDAHAYAEARSVLEAAVAEHPSRRRALADFVQACAGMGDWVTGAAFAARLEETTSGEEGELPVKYVERLRAFHAGTGGTHRLAELDAELSTRRDQALARLDELLSDASGVAARSAPVSAVVPSVPVVLPEPTGTTASTGPREQREAPKVSAEELAHVAALVKRHTGFTELREGQAETLVRVLRGEDVLAIMPTGGGKSICYQLPGVLGQGVTLVVSPLLALMKDQIDSMPGPMRAAAISITSELSPAQARRALDEVAQGRYRLVFVAPERLRQATLLRALRQAGVARLVVDEAHCVSVWGHDFRPDYLGISEARRALGDPPILALTATAPPRVAKDIAERLGALTLVRASIARPNLRFEAVLARDADEKLRQLFALCKAQGGPGLVYASSRAKCEQLASALSSANIGALAYHAGLPDRAARQEAFMEGRVDVMVATVAFGMGVDKGDIRFVIHHDPSSSLENYSQEAGRAGRDGAPARCVLLATGADGGTLKMRAKQDLPSRELLADAWRLALDAAVDGIVVLDVDQVNALDPQDDVKPRVALSILAEAGALERLADTPLSSSSASRALVFRIRGDTSRVEAVLDRYAALADQRAKEIMDYVRTRQCRHKYLRAYFGESAPERCDNCDNCLGLGHEAGAPPAADDEAARRAILDALQNVRGVGELNLVWLLRGDARAADWLQDRAQGAFGVLAMRSESRIKALVRELEQRGLIARETLDHGGSSLKISGKGIDANFSPEPLGVPPPIEPKPRRQREPADAPTLTSEGDGPLFDALKRWRRERAEADGVPPYVVAHDATLRLVAQASPRTLEELGSIKGFGPIKLQKYGLDVLAVVERSLGVAPPFAKE